MLLTPLLPLLLLPINHITHAQVLHLLPSSSVVHFRPIMMRQSDIFSSPLRGTALDRVNSQFDTISTCLDSLQTKAENSFKEISAAIAEVREAVEERRSFVIRGAIPDNLFDLTIIPENGDFRWCWLVSTSSKCDITSFLSNFYLGLPMEAAALRRHLRKEASASEAILDLRIPQIFPNRPTQPAPVCMNARFQPCTEPSLPPNKYQLTPTAQTRSERGSPSVLTTSSPRSSSRSPSRRSTAPLP